MNEQPLEFLVYELIPKNQIRGFKRVAYAEYFSSGRPFDIDSHVMVVSCSSQDIEEIRDTINHETIHHVLEVLGEDTDAFDNIIKFNFYDDIEKTLLFVEILLYLWGVEK